MGVFYLKKEKDINLYGHTFDAYCLDIDSECSMINLGEASKDYYTLPRIGSGVLVRGGANYQKRIITLKLEYYDPISTERANFIKNWIFSDDVKYLYRDVTAGLQRIKVYANNKGNESWKNYTVSEDINIELLTESPFFTNVTATTYTATLTSMPTIISINNDGIACPFTIDYIFTNNAASFSAKMFENVGIDITYAFLALNTLKIDTSNLNVYINGQLRFVDAYYSFTGSPFRIEAGDNNLTISSPSVGDIVLTYYKRYI
jgi:hypothetical protein